ncbi:MAG: 2-phospho-L-lactate transferase [Rhodospirillales bacterium]|nr:2-phospho-L-lactate transferase [Rhodospirillales bacterium]
MKASDVRCVALSGGIGGAKLAVGLSKVLAPGELLVVANTGDDFEHLGLNVCPDIDTLTYTLAGINDPETGWGRAGETWNFMAALEAIGGETWFRLGDGDLALHVERTRRLASGESLEAITADVARQLGVEHRIVPMSDDRVRTIVETADGDLAFQEYFVRQGCGPRVSGFRFDGAVAARPSPALLDALARPALEAVVICPSNPFISIDPIVALPALREALGACHAPVVAISPIVGGAALKGPTAKIMGELGLPVTAAAVAGHYGALLDGFLVDATDVTDASNEPAIEVAPAHVVMDSLEDRVRLAAEALDFARRLARQTAPVKRRGRLI